MYIAKISDFYISLLFSWYERKKTGSNILLTICSVSYVRSIHMYIQRRLKSIHENKMADVNEFELLLFAPLKYTR